MVNNIIAVLEAQRIERERNARKTLNIHQLTDTMKPTKYKLADHMRNSMHMPTEMLEHLEVYKKHHWQVPRFKNELKDGTLKIAEWGEDVFNIIYHQCTPAAAKAAKEIRLSFRKAKPEFGIEPYVLVQVVIQD